MSDAPAEPAAANDVRPASRSAARRSWLFWVAALAIFAGDLTTKSIVFGRLDVDPTAFTSYEDFIRRRPADRIELLGDHVQLVATLNPGMMWGALDRYPGLLKVVRPLAVLVILLLLGSIPAEQWTSRLALGGILGGALGNIYDSFRYIGVRDFLEVRFRGVPVLDPFPAFNLADSAICVGVVVLALGMMRAPKEAPRPAAPAAS